MRFWSIVWALLWGMGPALDLAAQSNPPTPAKPAPPKRTKWDDMDIGPFQAHGLEVRKGKRVWRPALKGLSINLGGKAAVCFDTERLRMAVGWTGGFLKLPTAGGGLEGTPQPAGKVVFNTPMIPGWAGPKGEWVEPNPPTITGNDVYSRGPLPVAWAQWRGHYTHGQRVVLSYSVGASSVLECPGYSRGIFTRQFEIARSLSKNLMRLLVCEVVGGKGAVEGNIATLESNGTVTAAAVLGSGVELEIEQGRIVAELKSLQPTSQFMIALWRGPRAQLGAFKKFAAAEMKLQPLSALTKGGPPKWEQPITTIGKLGDMPGPYVVDTLTLPEKNPWRSWIRCSGFDFFKDGKSAALCSVTGDVWIVSGIDDGLKALKWRRFATGLFQPLGLKIVAGKVHVLGRDQITRFHDLNNDGEADFYENFNNAVSISNHHQSYCLNLETDATGNFYFIKAGNLHPAAVPHDGCLLKVSANGNNLEVIATGHHSRNGLGIGPKGEITSSDNTGFWVPTARLNLVKPGQFYGHVPSAHRPEAPVDYAKPLLWLPPQTDNGSAAQTWVTSDRWGPFKGDLLHLSQGKCALFKIMHEEIDGQGQGAAIRFPLRFESGIMRGRFNPGDGQLYLAGMRAWQTDGVHDGAFHRVRYTGKPVYMPKELHVKKNAIAITFTIPVDPVVAVNIQNWVVHQWNYQWTKEFGSKMYSAKNPSKIVSETQPGNPVAVRAIKVSDDKKTVLLEIADLKPVMQSRIKFNMKFADGMELMNQEIIHTINRVPAQ
jgi:hypothetical protein